MDNSDSIQTAEQDKNIKKSGPLIMFIGTFLLVVIALWQFSGGKVEKRQMDPNELVKSPPQEKSVEAPVIVEVEEAVIAPVEIEIAQIEMVVEEEVVLAPPVIQLPSLDESDDFVRSKLPELTWRNELLTLLIDEDMIRRFVVFTDNFSQGLVAYEHSLFVQPKVNFKVDETSKIINESKDVWKWDAQTTKRFDLYVDLLRSVDSTTLVNSYFELKPLIDEAYSELGYEENFTYTLQDAITRVLDMELPKTSMDVTRTSVMYKYQDPQLEALADSDKLLLRIGKENLLIIKSVLLEINEKLTKQVDSHR